LFLTFLIFWLFERLCFAAIRVRVYAVSAILCPFRDQLHDLLVATSFRCEHTLQTDTARCPEPIERLIARIVHRLSQTKNERRASDVLSAIGAPG
jgi:hypothetical protein